MRRLSTLLLTSLALLALSATSAFAQIDGGQGLVGETNDLQVTLYGFAVIIGIPAFALIMSLGQARLDKRKYAKLSAAKARAKSRDQRLGW